MRRALGAALKRELDQAGIAAVKVAQQVDRVGQVARRVATRRLEQGIEVRMASAAVARDADELSLGDVGRWLADGPVDRHSPPLMVPVLGSNLGAGF